MRPILIGAAVIGWAIFSVVIISGTMSLDLMGTRYVWGGLFGEGLTIEESRK